VPGFELVGDDELEEIGSVFAAGGVLFRHGFDGRRNGVYKVAEFERAFADYMGATESLAVTSGTAALRVALAALGVGEGDSVMIPTFTFVATAEAVIEAGATPICVDVDLSLNMDPGDLERKIRPGTKAAIVVHMLGTPADLRSISAICDRHDIALIEDAAWGCGGALDGRKLGTWGRIGAYSFDFAKTLTTGEGGMLVFQDPADRARAAAWHDHGHENNPAVPRWEDTRASSGFNFRMNELQGAVGLAQLRKLDVILAGQARHHEELRQALDGIAGITVRPAPNGSSSTNDAFVFQTPDADAAQRCRSELLEIGQGTKILPEAISWHFAGEWSHMPELAEGLGRSVQGAFPTSESILRRSVAMPILVHPGDVPSMQIREAVTRAVSSA
jgi:8-amino-3,8-dideoxy-alpha-D-manno-octulosonate transaminase